MNAKASRAARMRLKAALWFIGATAVLYGATGIAWQMGLDPTALFGWSERTYALIEPIRWYLALARISVMRRTGRGQDQIMNTFSPARTWWWRSLQSSVCRVERAVV